MPGRRGPGELMHDQRVEPREGLAQTVDVLVVMEGIAAGPVDARLAILAIAGAGIEQHIGDARHRAGVDAADCGGPFGVLGVGRLPIYRDRGSLATLPSHTTVHTGPYTAVHRIERERFVLLPSVSPVR